MRYLGAPSSVFDKATATSFLEMAFEQYPAFVLLAAQTTSFIAFGLRPPKSNSDTACLYCSQEESESLTPRYLFARSKSACAYFKPRFGIGCTRIQVCNIDCRWMPDNLQFFPLACNSLHKASTFPSVPLEHRSVSNFPEPLVSPCIAVIFPFSTAPMYRTNKL